MNLKKILLVALFILLLTTHISFAQGLLFNFEDVSLETLINFVAEKLSLTFIIPPEAKDITITVRSTSPIPEAKVFSVFKSILEVYGFTVVRNDSIVKIVPTGQAKTKAIKVQGLTTKPPGKEDEMIIQIIPLSYIKVGSVLSIIQPLLSQGSYLASLTESNVLIIVDFATNISKILSIISAIDIEEESLTRELIKIKYSKAEIIAQKLMEIFEEGQTAPIQTKPTNKKTAPGQKTVPEQGNVIVISKTLKILPIPWINSILVIGTDPIIQEIKDIINQIDVEDKGKTIKIYTLKYSNPEKIVEMLDGIYKEDEGVNVSFISLPELGAFMVSSFNQGIFKEVEDLLKKVDVPGLKEEIFVYHLKNADAEKLADLLSELYLDEESTTKAISPSKKPEKTQKTPTKTVTPKPTTTKPTEEVGGIKISKIVPDPGTNSLIIKATPLAFEEIKKTIEKLDILPLQVLIQVIIAEITLDDSDLSGIDWNMLGDTYSIGTNFDLKTSGLEGLLGFQYAIHLPYLPDQILMLLRAYAAKSRLKILATPTILTSNNKEAIINVGEEVPYVKLVKVTETGVKDKTIEYKDVGMKLTVTPHINHSGFVTLELLQEVKNLTGKLYTEYKSEGVSKREAKTTLVVKDKETVVIGGLMKTVRKKFLRKAPILGDIPLIGGLFKSVEKKDERTELIILITPHIITTPKELKEVTAAMTSKKWIQEDIDEAKIRVKKETISPTPVPSITPTPTPFVLPEGPTIKRPKEIQDLIDKLKEKLKQEKDEEK